VAIGQTLGAFCFYNGLPRQTSLNAAKPAAFGGTGFERRLEPGEDDGEVI
jgi:hypothetical protein